jgi:hypothetical protein
MTVSELKYKSSASGKDADQAVKGAGVSVACRRESADKPEENERESGRRTIERSHSADESRGVQRKLEAVTAVHLVEFLDIQVYN